MARNYWNLWREQEKRMQNNSYMIVNIRDYLQKNQNDASLVGYFTLTSKPITIKEGIFSKNVQRKILRVSEHSKERQTFHLSAYLIAQLGKNFTEGSNNKITGKQLIKIAIDKVKEVQYMIGGMVAFLEAEKNDKLNVLVQMLVMV